MRERERGVGGGWGGRERGEGVREGGREGSDSFRDINRERWILTDSTETGRDTGCVIGGAKG